MSESTFPTLIKSKATLLGSLSRIDLALLGITYLILSWMKVSGLLSLFIGLLVFFISKLIDRELPKGFFRFLRTSRVISWKRCIGEVHEK